MIPTNSTGMQLSTFLVFRERISDTTDARDKDELSMNDRTTSTDHLNLETKASESDWPGKEDPKATTYSVLFAATLEPPTDNGLGYPDNRGGPGKGSAATLLESLEDKRARASDSNAKTLDATAELADTPL